MEKDDKEPFQYQDDFPSYQCIDFEFLEYQSMENRTKNQEKQKLEPKISLGIKKLSYTKRQNYKLTDNQDKQIYVCKMCTRQFSSGRALGGHLQRPHRI